MLGGTINLLTDTIKVMLLDADAAPTADTNFVSDLSADELSGTGYTGGFNGSGRKSLASKTVTEDDVNDRAYFDAADLTWSSIDAGTAAWAILIKEVTTDADSIVIAAIDITDTLTNGGDLTVNWSADGLLRLA